MATIDSEVIEKILQIKKWTPIKALVNLKLDTFFDSNYYIASNFLYLQTSKIAGNDFSSIGSGPFSIGILCVGGTGAASRIICGDIEKDDYLYPVVNESIWPSQYDLTYRGAIDLFKSDGLPFLESADYRIATDGAFIFKTIENKKYKLFFRSNDIKDNEVPFGILYKLE